MRSGPGGLAADWVRTTQAPCATRTATNRPASAVLFIDRLLRWSRRRRRRGGTHADDLQHAFLVARAVVVNLLRGVHHEAAGRHGLEAGGVVVGTRVHPPGSREDRDVAVVRMRVGPAV